MNLNSKIFGITQVLVSTVMMIAQSTSTKLPGDPTLVSTKATLEKFIDYDKGNFKYKVEDYFVRPKASQFRFPPTDSIFLIKKKIRTVKIMCM